MKDEEIQQSIFDSSDGSNLSEHRGSLDKLREDLSQFGLTSNQSKVYIFLGKYGSKTAPEVCKSLKLPRTETYHLLTTLQNKGIVSATFQHPIRFSATPLNKAIWVLVNAEKERVNMLERQEKSIVELWDTIPEFSTTSEEKEDKFQMLEGANQIHSKITELYTSTRFGCNKRQDVASRFKNTPDKIISFSDLHENYVICIVDVVDSTKITASLPEEKMCKYYGVFLNGMAMIAKEFGATVVKNLGDSLLYYFPESSEDSNKTAFADMLECNMAMLQAHPVINGNMQEESLSPVNYRISADYGRVMIAKSVYSLTDEIFGSPVNICSKINPMASPNGMVIGGNLHQIVKSFGEYHFKEISGYSLGFKVHYPVYSVLRDKAK